MADQKPPTRKERDELTAFLETPETKQAMVNWFNSHAKEISQVSAEFYMVYGQAMDGWSAVEGGLALWFSKLTKMPPKRARRIFYSSRSFNGRADMFDAALSATRVPKELRAFLKAAVKTARKYSSFRNQLAHGEANIHTGYEDDKPTFEMLITEPKYMERSTREYGLSSNDIKVADQAFRMLASDLIAAFHGDIVGTQLEEHRERILQRPNLPNPYASVLNSANKKKQLRSHQG